MSGTPPERRSTRGGPFALDRLPGTPAAAGRWPRRDCSERRSRPGRVRLAVAAMLGRCHGV